MEGIEAYGDIPAAALHSRLLITFGETLLLGVIYAFSEVYCPLSAMREDIFYENSYVYVLFYVVFSTSLARSKYYFGWKLSMCAVHASGVSYNGTDFSRVNTANPLVVETTIHVREKINFWNISVQEWLRKCIYQRVSFKNKTANQLFVFVVSAFWHGFYAAYYISFALWFAQLYLQGLIFKYCKNGKSILVKVYNRMGKVGTFLLSLLVQFLFSHCGAYFLILRGYYCIKLLNKLWYMPVIVLFILIIVFSVIRPPRDSKPTKDSSSSER